MPLDFSNLRTGEVRYAEAHPVDTDGEAAFTQNEAWSVPVGTAVTAVEDGSVPTVAAITAIQPGAATVRFAADSALGDGFTADQPVVVLDATRVSFWFSEATNCTLTTSADGRLHIRPTSASSASFVIIAAPRDTRDDNLNLPSYSLTEEEWSTASQRILFDGFGAVATDVMEVTAQVDSAGQDTLSFAALNSSSAPITATLELTVHGATAASFEFHEVDPT